MVEAVTFETGLLTEVLVVLESGLLDSSPVEFLIQVRIHHSDRLLDRFHIMGMNIRIVLN